MRRSFCVAVLLSMALVVSCSQQNPSGVEKTSLEPSSTPANVKDALFAGGMPPFNTSVSAGNGIYTVHVQDDHGSGVGVYTITTGPAHPVTLSTGSAQNVLFGGGVPSTSYNTIRSYTSGTVYTQAGVGGVWLDPFATAFTPVGTTGFSTTYTLTTPAAADNLTIVSVVNVNGGTINDSSVEVTTTVTNTGNSVVLIGIRYLWDTQIGGDDGPPFAERNPDQPDLIYEKDWIPPGFSFYRIQDNDINVPTPLFAVYGTVNGPAAVVPTPTPPPLLQHAAWPLAYSQPFFYSTNPALDICTLAAPNRGAAGGDNCVLYTWGHTTASSIGLQPGESITVSQSLFAAEPDEPPPFEKLPVNFDIHPMSCPNPLNVGSGGVTPAAILGTADFDVTQIDFSTLTLAGVSPLRWSFEDVATPFDGELCGCTAEGPDGYVDMTLKFKTQELVAALGAVENGQQITLTLSGSLLDGTEIEGKDCVIIRGAGPSRRATQSR